MLKAKLFGSKKANAFTLVEILVVIAILAILAVVTFVVINPVQRINESNDSRVRQEVESILGALSLYVVDNAGALPTVGGTALPTVTSATVMTDGVAANTVTNISPRYLSTIPAQPSGAQYRVGRTSANALLVGGTLSDGTVYTKSQ